jgi:hypothetical protein
MTRTALWAMVAAICWEAWQLAPAAAQVGVPPRPPIVRPVPRLPPKPPPVVPPGVHYRESPRVYPFQHPEHEGAESSRKSVIFVLVCVAAFIGVLVLAQMAIDHREKAAEERMRVVQPAAKTACPACGGSGTVWCRLDEGLWEIGDPCPRCRAGVS